MFKRDWEERGVMPRLYYLHKARNMKELRKGLEKVEKSRFAPFIEEALKENISKDGLDSPAFVFWQSIRTILMRNFSELAGELKDYPHYATQMIAENIKELVEIMGKIWWGINEEINDVYREGVMKYWIPFIEHDGLAALMMNRKELISMRYSFPYCLRFRREEEKLHELRRRYLVERLAGEKGLLFIPKNDLDYIRPLPTSVRRIQVVTA